MDPASFKILFANSFQEDYLAKMIDILHDFYIMYVLFDLKFRNKEFTEALELLRNLILVPRFGMIQMFLSRAHKQSKF